MPYADAVSLVLWLRLHGWIFSAAFLVTVKDSFSSSPLAFWIEMASTIAAFVIFLRTQISQSGGVWQMIRKREIIKAFSVGGTVFVCCWVSVFLANVASVQREMVSSPPSLNMGLKLPPYTLTLQPGMVIVPQEYLRDRFQYELDITNTSNKLDISPLDIRFQWPYGVESSEVKSKDRDDDVVSFSPDSPKMTVSGDGTLSVHGPPAVWRNCKLHVSKLSPTGKIAIVFRMYGILDPRAASLPKEYAPIAEIPRDERLFATGSFSFSMGGQERSRDYYAPMWLDDKRTLHVIDGFYRIPEDLAWDFEVMP